MNSETTKIMNTNIIYNLKVMKLNENGEVIGVDMKSFTEYPKLNKEVSPINNIYVLPTIRMIGFENEVKRKRRVTVFRMCCCNCFLGGEDNLEEDEAIELQYK